MNELDILKDRKKSIEQRLKDLSEKILKETDSTTKVALVNNLHNGMKELNDVKAQINEIIKNQNHD